MDPKIRIHFFPRDASRVRILSFSRRRALGLLGLALSLCLLGFWLILSGALREDPARRTERAQLERQNRILRERIHGLRSEAEVLAQGLDSLESARIRASLATGFGGRASRSPEEADGGIGFFPALGSPRVSERLARSLGQVRKAGLFFDSALFLLRQEPVRAARFPTSPPLDPGAFVIRGFGLEQDPFTGRRALHAGVDFSLRPGARVLAAGSGRVASAGMDPMYGLYVRLVHADDIETFYAHLQQLRVRTGETVARGQVLGTLGQTGMASGPHLHFEMRLRGEKVDPLPYLIADGDGR